MSLVAGIYLPDFGADGGGIDYVPAGITSYARERLRVFLPDAARWPKPLLGYRAVLLLDLVDWTSSTLPASIGPSDTFAWTLLNDLGVAVVAMTAVVVVPGGPAEVPGNALFFAPGHVPAGWTGSDAPHETLSRPIPERDVAWAIQHLRANAWAYGLNRYALGFRGDGAGAVAGDWVVRGPDRRRQYGRGGQHEETTRLSAAVMLHPRGYWPVFDTGLAGTHFADTGGAPDFEAEAATLADTFAESLEGNSASLYEDAEANDSQRLLLWADGVPDNVADFALPPAAAETDYDSAWCAIAADGQHDGFHLAIPAAVDAAVTPPNAPDAVVEAAAIEAYAAAWIAANLVPIGIPYEVFDLVSEGPAERVSVRRSIRDKGLGPRFAREADARPVRRYTVTIRHARPSERRRYGDLWSRSRFGAIPVLLPHREDGLVPVLLEAPDRHWRQNSASSGQLQVDLVEAIGQ